MTTPPRFASDDAYDTRIEQEKQKSEKWLRVAARVLPLIILISCIFEIQEILHPQGASSVERALHHTSSIALVIAMTAGWRASAWRLRQASALSREGLYRLIFLLGITLEQGGRGLARAYHAQQMTEFWISGGIFLAFALFFLVMIAIDLKGLIKKRRIVLG
ncbi:hypothetical protein [Capsulimonas corticalis]|uniref:hypothetical protein n=1 Tax=Capsulimonas corticalis TaxID=2219043 RepID=UPI000E65BF9F|nr:hypothetical protein [Capsulimonas corticalis]